jgi:hypothetical protein
MNRMYASTNGRMTTPDQGPMSLSKPSTFNRYAYGGLDPINNVDPSGNTWMNVDACISFGLMAEVFLTTRELMEIQISINGSAFLPTGQIVYSYHLEMPDCYEGRRYPLRLRTSK